MSGVITAKELIDKLNNNPEYLARMRDIDLKQKLSAKEYDLAAKDVVNELRQMCFRISYVGQLYHGNMCYEVAIPVLMKWLPKIDNIRVKEDIVRALTVKWAKPQAGPLLVDEYDKAMDSLLRWAIGNALSVVADDGVCDDLMRLAKDIGAGIDRQMIVVALGNMKNPAAVDVLIKCLKDENVSGHALMALRKLKAAKARSYIEPFLSHKITWKRNEAKKATKAIDKAILKKTKQ